MNLIKKNFVEKIIFFIIIANFSQIKVFFEQFCRFEVRRLWRTEPSDKILHRFSAGCVKQMQMDVKLLKCLKRSVKYPTLPHLFIYHSWYVRPEADCGSIRIPATEICRRRHRRRLTVTISMGGRHRLRVLDAFSRQFLGAL